MNAQVADSDDTDRLFCWQQVLRVRPLFHISYPYAPREISAGLLALYALFSALEEALCRVSDESVARAKLDWWQQQLLGPEYRISTHPIVRQLYLCDVFAKETHEYLPGLLATTMARLDAPAPADEQEFKALCLSIGLYPMQLELAMQGECAAENAFLAAACAVNGLVQLLRESSRSEMPPYTWVPLNLLARHGLVQPELNSGAQSDKTTLLMQQLRTLGLSWIKDEITVDESTDYALNADADWRRRHRHWIIQTQLAVRRLKNLKAWGKERHDRVFSTTSPLDAWLAWRSARKISSGGGHW